MPFWRGVISPFISVYAHLSRLFSLSIVLWPMKWHIKFCYSWTFLPSRLCLKRYTVDAQYIRLNYKRSSQMTWFWTSVSSTTQLRYPEHRNTEACKSLLEFATSQDIVIRIRIIYHLLLNTLPGCISEKVSSREMIIIIHSFVPITIEIFVSVQKKSFTSVNNPSEVLPRIVQDELNWWSLSMVFWKIYGHDVVYNRWLYWTSKFHPMSVSVRWLASGSLQCLLDKTR